MDTFGRLPSDVIDDIKFIYQLPSIVFDSVEGPKLIITINCITVELKLYNGSSMYVEELNEMIDALYNNQCHRYMTFEMTNEKLILADYGINVKIEILSTCETRALMKDAFIEWVKYVENFQLLKFGKIPKPFKNTLGVKQQI